MKILPILKTHYSLGKSILSLEAAGKSSPTEPDSIVDLALAEKMPLVPIVDDSMSGFLEAYKNLSDVKLNLCFGLRLSFVTDLNEKSDEALSKTAKYIIFIKNQAGYKRLIKIWTKAAHDGFYYEPRMDFKNLKDCWSDDLKLCVPFYDSFLHKNTLTQSVCVPDFSFTKPTFFIEDNNLLFDEILQKRVESYCNENKYPIVPAQSVYYAQKKDFKAYCTFRCIHKRTTLNKPQLDGFTSDSFCLESWKEKNGNFRNL